MGKQNGWAAVRTVVGSRGLTDARCPAAVLALAAVLHVQTVCVAHLRGA